eukprot:CAMPEP_0198147234 /NCGR_PEP_ID=MMETSP1443-20131203/34011_1 /TAXON_ID=186043 /ORGANISM="Entomoneis sp., Strain CCMP2396" /LENGTH=821 /DNA_ID=CAMNT_0043811463 /DNA_START=137 /DNA_END=2602 /DNA_ORIENTATION=-
MTSNLAAGMRSSNDFLSKNVYWYQKDPTNPADTFPQDMCYFLEQASSFCEDRMGGRLCYHDEICPHGNGGPVEIGMSVFDTTLSPISRTFTAYVPHQSCDESDLDEWMKVTNGMCDGSAGESESDEDISHSSENAIPCCVIAGDACGTNQEIAKLENGEIFTRPDLASIDTTALMAYAREVVADLADVGHLNDLPSDIQEQMITHSLKALSVPESKMPTMIEQVQLFSKRQGHVYEDLSAKSFYDLNRNRQHFETLEVDVVDCTIAIGFTLLDIVAFIWSLFSVSVKTSTYRKRKLVLEFEEEMEPFMKEGKAVFIRIKDAFNQGRKVNLAQNLIDLAMQIYNVFGFRLFKAVLQDLTMWDWISTIAFAVTQFVLLAASEFLALIPRVAKSLLYIGNIVNDIVMAISACGEVDNSTDGAGGRKLLSLAPYEATPIRDSSTCSSPDSQEFVVVMASTVKGIYQDFDAAYEVILTNEDTSRYHASGANLIRHGIVEVTSSGAKDPRNLQFNGRPQELGLTSGFLRYWKDERDVHLLMEQANNFLLFNYPDCTIFTNAVEDGGFESGQDVVPFSTDSDWFYYGDKGEIGLSNDFKYEGSTSLWLSHSEGSITYGSSAASQKLALAAKKGTKVTVSAYASKGMSINNKEGAKLSAHIFYDGTHTDHSSEFPTNDSSEWVFQSFTILLRDDMTSMNVDVSCNECGSVYFDNVSVYLSTATNGRSGLLGVSKTYTEVTSESCEFHGLKTIADVEECKSAASNLDKTVTWGPFGGYDNVVTGCSYRRGRGGGTSLFSNILCDPSVGPEHWSFTGCKCAEKQPCLCSTA